MLFHDGSSNGSSSLLCYAVLAVLAPAGLHISWWSNRKNTLCVQSVKCGASVFSVWPRTNVTGCDAVAKGAMLSGFSVAPSWAQLQACGRYLDILCSKAALPRNGRWPCLTHSVPASKHTRWHEPTYMYANENTPVKRGVFSLDLHRLRVQHLRPREVLPSKLRPETINDARRYQGTN